MDTRGKYFEMAMWPHMRAAYNFARWLVRNDHDAEDVVQESYLKAYKSLDTFRGGDARVWMLSIVRNTALNFLGRRKPEVPVDWSAPEHEPAAPAPNPERALLVQSRRDQIRQAIAQLAPEFREPLVLREIEEMSYKEIAGVLKIPIGTVMSRLSRARNLLLVELGLSRR